MHHVGKSSGRDVFVGDGRAENGLFEDGVGDQTVHLQASFVLLDIPVVAAEDSEDPAYDNRDDEGLVLGSANLSLDDVAVDVVEQQGSDVVADGAELRDQDAEPDALCISLCLLL